MKKIKELKEKIKKWYGGLPDKKKYIEFLTAVLSVPVLITVILINLGNLNQNKNKQSSVGATTTPIRIEVKTPTIADRPRISLSPEQNLTPTETPTSPNCKKEVGPVSITSPKEGETITSDPLCIEISYEIGEYCAVAWSYKINDGTWSSYTDKDICLYNMTSGKKTLKLKVKSIASSDEETLERNFIYTSGESQASSSAE